MRSQSRHRLNLINEAQLPEQRHNSCGAQLGSHEYVE